MVGVRLNGKETNEWGFTVGAAQQSLVFLELYPLTAGNRKEWESRLLVGNVCIYSGPVRVRERERRKKKKRKEKKRKKKKPKETKGPLVETEVCSGLLAS